MKSTDTLLLLTISSTICILPSCSIANQTEPFSIELIKTEEAIRLKCAQGCAWKDLSFGSKNHQPRLIDEYGIVTNQDIDRKHPQLSDFTFEVLKSPTSIELTGIKGTTWESLSFNINDHQPQTFNEKGIMP